MTQGGILTLAGHFTNVSTCFKKSPEDSLSNTKKIYLLSPTSELFPNPCIFGLYLWAFIYIQIFLLTSSYFDKTSYLGRKQVFLLPFSSFQGLAHSAYFCSIAGPGFSRVIIFRYYFRLSSKLSVH